MQVDANPLWPYETDFPKLAGDITVDIVIIGGGIAGVSSAYFLGKKGYKVALIEREQIGSVATGASSGTLFYGTGLGFGDTIKAYGSENAKILLKETESAINDMISLIEKEKLECGLRKTSMIDVAVSEDEMGYIEREDEVSKEFGIRSKLLKSDEIQEIFSGKVFALGVERFCAQIQPGRFVAALSKLISSKFGVQIYENTPMFSFKDNGGKVSVKTENGTITANKMIVATNIEPFEGIEKHFKIENSTVLPSKPLGDRIKEVFRQDKILETTFEEYDLFYTLEGRAFFEVYKPKGILDKTKQYFPDWVEFDMDNIWGDSWAKSEDELPIVGRVTSNIISMIAMGDQGIVMGYSSARRMADVIENNIDPFLEMMSPKRLVK